MNCRHGTQTQPPRAGEPLADSAAGHDFERDVFEGVSRADASVDTGESESFGSSGVVVFGGDIVPHSVFLDAYARDGDAVFGPIRSVIEHADIALANLETPVAPSKPVTQAQFFFNVHEDFVRTLVATGFDGVVMANNHAFDRGIAGVGEGINVVRSKGLKTIGAALGGEDPLVPTEFQLAGGILCVIAATRLLNFDMTMPGPSQPRIGLAQTRVRVEEQALLTAVRTARGHCGAIIVSLHSGVEYTDRPEPVDKLFFPQVAEAGADVVIGHHPHTVHPVQSYTTSDGRAVPIYFSIGNLVSNQGGSAEAQAHLTPDNWKVSLDPRTREGLLVVLRFTHDRSRHLALARWGWLPMWTVHRRSETSRTPDIRAALMPREGGGSRFLSSRWQRLIAQTGPGLLEIADVAGAASAYEASVSALGLGETHALSLDASVPHFR